MPSILNATTTSGLVTSADNSGSLQLQTNNGTTAVTIDTSQNATFANSVLGTASTFQVGVNTSGKDARFGVLSGGNGRVEFYSAGSEQMRIATDGTISTTIGSTLYGAYSARAWVNFNGTSTVAIRASRNVSSITDSGTGQYTVNFTTSMPDGEYSLVGTTNADTRVVSISSLSTSGGAIRTTNAAGALEDQSVICVTIFR